MLAGDRISEWLSVDEDMMVNVDSDGVLAYVKELAKKYKAYTLSVEAQGKTIEPDSETLDIVTKEKLEIREQKVQHNATMRVLQREQSIKDIARETAEIISQRLPLIMPKKEKTLKKSSAKNFANSSVQT